jgi:ATP-dependent Clp protease ATP-binding subunit ClpC
VLSTVSEPGFWERDDRFDLLAEAEYLERMQVATHTAERLGARLQRSTKDDGRANPRLVGLLAGRLYVLDRALAGVANGSSIEVVVSLRPSGVARGDYGIGDEFAAVLTEMYVAWADRRGMSAELLDAADGRRRLAISGLGCGEILGLEAGLHVLEHVSEAANGGKVVDRDQVQVVVSGPGSGSPEAMEASNVVVRRYRPGKSPLVRDSVRGYRTGRLDLVLGGDFDLF